ncbi:hypothetical protein [Microtetraspora malaysiensis]|uniref:hypothetical protein n=1 Tax=Microtetraspora malaysiensis TaxID=161358 RepID=UPI003D8F81DF
MPSEDLMPNPRHQELRAALVAVREHAAMLEAALDRPCAEFGNDPVWVGPTARAFGAELNGRRSRVQTAIQHMLAELEAELRATPAQIPRRSA